MIVEAIRTPLGRRGGVFKDVHPVDLLAHLYGRLMARAGIAPERVDDVLTGCVDQVGEQAANIGRNAWLAAGLPESVPATTIDRQCGSSLQAVHFAAQGVMAGSYDLAVAAGVESMTRVPLLSTLLTQYGRPLTESLQARYDGLPRGWFDQAVGAQMIADQWGFSRADLDCFSYESQMRATAAREAGLFQAEIEPVHVRLADGGEALVDSDEGIRPSTTIEKLGALQPAFPGLSLLTAGNSSQMTDGASACLIASPETAGELGLRPRARIVSLSVVGVNPVIMLTGPIPATRKALQRAGLTIDDIDLIEINEAFAPVVLAWQKEFGAPWDRINVNGGAIALGHPLGATGTRIVATMLHELERRGGRYGLIAICEGGGMANATIIERLAG